METSQGSDRDRARSEQPQSSGVESDVCDDPCHLDIATDLGTEAQLQDAGMTEQRADLSNGDQLATTVINSMFGEVLMALTGWPQGKHMEETECSALCTHLCECERIIKTNFTKHDIVDLDRDLVQRVSHILHDLLCWHIPGECCEFKVHHYTLHY